MNVKYKKYIDYIAKDIEPPYFKSLDAYGLPYKEYELVLSKVYNQPVTIKGNRVFDSNGNEVYVETSTGYWFKREYDDNDNLLYWEDSYGDIRDNR